MQDPFYVDSGMVPVTASAGVVKKLEIKRRQKKETSKNHRTHWSRNVNCKLCFRAPCSIRQVKIISDRINKATATGCFWTKLHLSVKIWNNNLTIAGLPLMPGISFAHYCKILDHLSVVKTPTLYLNLCTGGGQKRKGHGAWAWRNNWWHWNLHFSLLLLYLNEREGELYSPTIIHLFH